MQKWEYCRIKGWVSTRDESYSLSVFDGTNKQWVSIKRDKSKGDSSDQDAVDRVFYQLGLDGWELVTSARNRDYLEFYFKRLKS